jgi:hypothetical protein
MIEVCIRYWVVRIRLMLSPCSVKRREKRVVSRDLGMAVAEVGAEGGGLEILVWDLIVGGS